MKIIDFPLQQYLERIGLSHAPQPDEQGLRQVHTGQAFSIPFENLDIPLGRTISLNPEVLADKLIHRRRGGYCFELNELLRLALKSLGFVVRPQLARVLYKCPNPTARTHEVLIVTISGREWLADVGFGGPGLRAPIPLVSGRIEEQFGERYRLIRDSRFGALLRKHAEDGFFDLYAFDQDEVTLDADLEMANHYTSTWPESIFRLQRMCALPAHWGRVTLTDMELTIYRGGEITSRTLSPGSEYMSALTEHFGIDLNMNYEDLSPLKSALGA